MNRIFLAIPFTALTCHAVTLWLLIDIQHFYDLWKTARLAWLDLMRLCLQNIQLDSLITALYLKFFFGRHLHGQNNINKITLVSITPLIPAHPSSAHPVLLNLECLISRNYKDLLGFIKIIRLNWDPLPRPPLVPSLPLSVRDTFTVI